MYRLRLKKTYDTWKVAAIDVMKDKFLVMCKDLEDFKTKYEGMIIYYDAQEHYFDDFDLAVSCAKYIMSLTEGEDALERLRKAKKKAAAPTVINVLNFLQKEGIETKIVAIDNGKFVNYYYYDNKKNIMNGIYIYFYNRGLCCRKLVAKCRNQNIEFSKNKYCTYYTRNEIAKRNNITKNFILKITV